MTELAARVLQALNGRSIKELAAQWGIPRWVIDELIHGRLRMPGATYLLAIANGLGTTVEELISEAAPPKENGRRPAPGGKRRGIATASTS